MSTTNPRQLCECGHMHVQHYPKCLGDTAVRDGQQVYEHCTCTGFRAEGVGRG